MDEILDLTDSNFDEEIVNEKNLAMVYFYTLWQEQCREDLELMPELTEKYQNLINFYKIDMDRNPHIVSRFEVNSAPTVLFLEKGEEIKKIEGEINFVELEVEIQEFTGFKSKKDKKSNNKQMKGE